MLEDVESWSETQKTGANYFEGASEPEQMFRGCLSVLLHGLSLHVPLGP